MKLFYDLHLHSCLSPCADDDMTPANIAAMCALAGLEVVALTDHNSAGNCRAFSRAALRHGLLPVPGLELSTAEEIHVVCLFADIGAAETFSDLVAERLRGPGNVPSIFGHQFYMDDGDTVLGEEHRLLSGSTDIGIYEVTGLMALFDGLAFPAHIDRGSSSLLSNLGLWDPALSFPLAERNRDGVQDALDARPDLDGVRLITNSDAHSLERIFDAEHSMDLPARTARDVLDWLRRGGR